MPTLRRSLPRPGSGENLHRWAELVTAQLNGERSPDSAAGGRAPAVDVRDFNGDDATGANDATAAVNAALLAAATTGACFLSAGTRRVSTARVPSGVGFFGAGPSSELLSDGSDAPILASQNFFGTGGSGINGRSRIYGLRLRGSNDQTKSGQHGLVFRDYYSEVSDLEVVDTGGSAIVLTHKDSSGVGIAGTLVENFFRHIRVRNCRGKNPIVLGEVGNPSLTDGVLDDFVVYGYRTGAGADTGYTMVSIGKAAGWQVTGGHVYVFGSGAVHPRTCFDLRDAGRAFLDDLYLESYQDSGVYVAGGDLCTVGKLLTVADHVAGTGAAALYVDNGLRLRCSQVSVIRESGTLGTTAIIVDNGAAVYAGEPPVATGAQAATVAFYVQRTGGTVRVPNAAGDAWPPI